MNDVPTVSSQTPTDAPAWAVLQRRLIAAIDEAAPVFLEKYTRENGELIWRRGPQDDDTWADDLYEAFFNWPLFYALGGSDYTGEMAVRQWNAITHQLDEEDLGQVTHEFVNAADWFHHGENYVYLYYLGFMGPGIPQMPDRARRFADWYVGADPAVPNYDRKHRIIPSPITGGLGPQVRFPVPLMKYHLGNVSVTVGPGFELPDNWFDDAELTRQVRQRYDQVVMREDVPVNLSSTALVTHAYLYTGEDRYRDWVIEYTEAWMERMERNGGIIPDNVGPAGEIGENRQGQWWGGFYGWTSRFAPGIITNGIIIASECAHLMTGDRRYLEFLRKHIDSLLQLAVERDGTLQAPSRCLDGEWTEYAEPGSSDPIHLWATSMEERDHARLQRLRIGVEQEWLSVQSLGPRGTDDRAWTLYLDGDLPDYPERILQANYLEVCRRLDMVMQDDSDLALVNEHHWQERNPVLTEALAHLTTGGPQAVYWGGLAQGRLRYFDADRRRPGLPEDVAALVTGLSAARADVTLVNLSPSRPRQLLIGAGSFGEHRFSRAEAVGGESINVDGSYLKVELRPGSEIDLRLGMDRYCNKPSYALPW